VEDIGRVDAFLEKHRGLLPRLWEAIKYPAALQAVLHVDPLCYQVDKLSIVKLLALLANLRSNLLAEAAVSVDEGLSDLADFKVHDAGLRREGLAEAGFA